MGTPQAQLFLSGVLADRESPEQPFVSQSKEPLSQTHVRLTGPPRVLVTRWLILGKKVTLPVPPKQLRITRSLQCMHGV